MHHVVRPERDTGRGVAHLLDGRFKDFAQFDEDYGMIKLSPPAMLIGKAIDPDRLWKKFHVRVISVRRNDVWEPLAPSHPITLLAVPFEATVDS
ncbi:hypothetical protein ACTXJY_07320 [Corynebacterium casei]|uniref:hypothetical protein n=1 Tax=Corynebacterium casei TaxID=160386 RepID=UPI003FD46A85